MYMNNLIYKLNTLLHNKSDVSMINLSSMNKELQGKEIIAESSIPESCSLGNLNVDKDYLKAIEKGEQIEAEHPNDYLVHCNMMESYFKIGDIENCNREAKLAIIKGHHTGYCENRLSINLYKQRKYHQVIQLSEIEENPRFGCFFEDIYKRKLRAQKQIDKAIDTEQEHLFTKEEIEELYLNVEKQKALREWYIETRNMLNEKAKQYIRNALEDDNALKNAQTYLDKVSELNAKYSYLY